MFIFDTMSKVCIILFQKTQKFDDVIKFLSFPREKIDLHSFKKITSCQKSWCTSSQLSNLSFLQLFLSVAPPASEGKRGFNVYLIEAAFLSFKNRHSKSKLVFQHKLTEQTSLEISTSQNQPPDRFRVRFSAEK